MHKLIATSTILEHELSELRLLVERQTGVVLDCPNSALAAHVADCIEAHGLGSSAALLERLRSSDQDPSSLPSLLDGLVNSQYRFFSPSRSAQCAGAAGGAAALRSQVAPTAQPAPHLERRLLHWRRDLLDCHGRLRRVESQRRCRRRVTATVRTTGTAMETERPVPR